MPIEKALAALGVLGASFSASGADLPRVRWYCLFFWLVHHNFNTFLQSAIYHFSAPVQGLQVFPMDHQAVEP